jgi:hypothetical protein
MAQGAPRPGTGHFIRLQGRSTLRRAPKYVLVGKKRAEWARCHRCPLLARDTVLFIWNIDMLQRNSVCWNEGPQSSSF